MGLSSEFGATPSHGAWAESRLEGSIVSIGYKDPHWSCAHKTTDADETPETETLYYTPLIVAASISTSELTSKETTDACFECIKRFQLDLDLVRSLPW